MANPHNPILTTMTELSEEMEDERVSKELDLLLEAEPDLGEEFSKFVSESESQMSQDEQMGSRKEREQCQSEKQHQSLKRNVWQ